jgi:hypothetical protein
MGVRATKEWLDEQLKRGHRIVSTHLAVSDADVEPVVSVPSVDAKADTGLDTSGRVGVHFTSYRHRLADPDGVSYKYCLDGITRSGKFFVDDSAEYITEVRTAQVKLASDQPEYTVVEIVKEG